MISYAVTKAITLINSGIDKDIAIEQVATHYNVYIDDLTERVNYVLGNSTKGK